MTAMRLLALPASRCPNQWAMRFWAREGNRASSQVSPTSSQEGQKRGASAAGDRDMEQAPGRAGIIPGAAAVGNAALVVAGPNTGRANGVEVVDRGPSGARPSHSQQTKR